jgi:glycosyltransferase involved in cell wall biosynthesis
MNEDRTAIPDGGDLVSVVVPVYNAARTLDETLRSVRAQTYANLEIVVVDDGSSDQSADIIRRHRSADPRIVFVEQANAGVAAARNRGIDVAKGAFIAPLDADDLWHPTKIERQMQVMKGAAGRLGVVYNWYAAINEDGVVTHLPRRDTWQGRVFREMLEYNFIGNGSTPLMRREAVLECGGYDPGLRARCAEGCEDFKLYLALAEHHQFGVVPGYLTGYRVYGSNMSSNGLRMLRSYDLVVEPVLRAHPELASVLHVSLFELIKWYLRRAVKARDWRQAMALTRRIARQYPRRTVRLLAGEARSGLRRALQNSRTGARAPVAAGGVQGLVGMRFSDWCASSGVVDDIADKNSGGPGS